MTVYVDDMFKTKMGQFSRMKMSHMVADTEDELHAMAVKIGMKRDWFQGDHYDVSLSKRRDAVFHGAVEVTMRQLGVMRALGRAAGKPLGSLKDAEKHLAALKERRDAAE